MLKLIQKFSQFLAMTKRSGLEEFITEHNPKNNCEVEQLTREYESLSDIWTRGL